MNNMYFIIVSIILFLLIFLRYPIPHLKLLFKSFHGIGTYYGYISLTFFFIEFLVWRALKLKSQIIRLRKGFKSVTVGYKRVAEDVLIFVGFKKPSLFEIALGFILGIACGATILSSILYFEKLTLQVLDLSTFLELFALNPLDMGGIYLVPILEELAFRGFFISRFMSVSKQRSFLTALLAVILSSFIFGYYHYKYPLYKVFVGFVLGAVYLWRWKKNIVITTTAHVTGNILLTFIHAA